MGHVSRHAAFFCLGSILLWLCLALLSGCKEGVPDDVIGRSRMTDLLYDYHVAQALATTSGDSTDYRTRLYTAAVFRKYGVTEQQFNRSMEYYCRHAEDLYKMYQKINKRLGAGTSVVGSSVAAYAAEGDTANVWRGGMCYLLSASGDNRLEYAFDADTLLRPSDRLLWNFSTRWIYHDGAKSAVAVLSVEYANDSVATTVKPVFTTGEQSVELYVGNARPRRVSCMLYQVSSFPMRPRYLVVTSPSLIRIRAKASPQKEEPAQAASSDSNAGKAPSVPPERILRDSLLKADSALRPHFR